MEKKACQVAFGCCATVPAYCLPLLITINRVTANLLRPARGEFDYFALANRSSPSIQITENNVRTGWRFIISRDAALVGNKRSARCRPVLLSALIWSEISGGAASNHDSNRYCNQSGDTNHAVCIASVNATESEQKTHGAILP
jgi:hypothetical protein